MIARIVAWGLVAVICGAVWQYGSKWRSPWAVPASPVLSALPVAAPGCGEDCE